MRDKYLCENYLCDDGKPYQWAADVIAAGLDHDYLEDFPSNWKSQTDAERSYV